MQIKMTLSFHLIHVRTAKIKKPQETAHAGKDVEQWEYSSFAGASENFYTHFANRFGSFSENWE